MQFIPSVFVTQTCIGVKNHTLFKNITSSTKVFLSTYCKIQLIKGIIVCGTILIDRLVIDTSVVSNSKLIAQLIINVSINQHFQFILTEKVRTSFIQQHIRHTSSYSKSIEQINC